MSFSNSMAACSKLLEDQYPCDEIFVKHFKLFTKCIVLKLCKCVTCGIERDAFLSLIIDLSHPDYTHCDCLHFINDSIIMRSNIVRFLNIDYIILDLLFYPT